MRFLGGGVKMIEVKYSNDYKKIYIMNNKNEVIKVILIGTMNNIIKTI